MVPSEMFFTNPSGPFRYSAGSRYYALNILAELNQPGDYYIDRSKGLLYFWPPAPITTARTWLSSLSVNLVRLRNTSRVIIQGITFEGTRTDAIVIQGGSQNVVGGCIIRNIGQYGVKIQGGISNGVDGCDMYNIGEGGIKLEGGDKKTLMPANNFANNNHVHHYARIIRTYQPAIKVLGVGNWAAHNLVHDAPQQGLLFEGNDHVIEFNEFYNLLGEINDNGVIYTGDDLRDHGTVIRYNLFHDIQYGYQRFSVYLDDSHSGSTVLGNIFWNAAVGVMLNGGNDNLIMNNLFLDCRFPCVIRPPNRNWKLLEGLRTVNPTQPPYSTRYPRMAKLLTEDIPNEFISNIAWPNKEPLPQSEFAGNKTNYFNTSKNLVGIDPRVLNPAGFSFQLGKQSPAFAYGFEQIPFERIGLYRDVYRPRFSLDK